VTRAVTVVLIVLDIVLVAVWDGVLEAVMDVEGVLDPDAVLVCVPV
jgi:hypothetical protein